jgi:hypothetical protein
MRSLRNAAVALVACGALVPLAACASGASTGTASTGSSPSAASSTTPTAAPSASPVASAPILTTAESAAKHLYAAWQAGDQATAAQGASAAAVSGLFAKAWADNTYFFGGCSGTECDYNYAAGVVKMTVTGDVSTGFTVSAVEFSSAG